MEHKTNVVIINKYETTRGAVFPTLRYEIKKLEKNNTKLDKSCAHVDCTGEELIEFYRKFFSEKKNIMLSVFSLDIYKFLYENIKVHNIESVFFEDGCSDDLDEFEHFFEGIKEIGFNFYSKNIKKIIEKIPLSVESIVFQSFISRTIDELYDVSIFENIPPSIKKIVFCSRPLLDMKNVMKEFTKFSEEFNKIFDSVELELMTDEAGKTYRITTYLIRV